eukprot:4172604-Prymnesium_polylepis.1
MSQTISGEVARALRPRTYGSRRYVGVYLKESILGFISPRSPGPKRCQGPGGARAPGRLDHTGTHLKIPRRLARFGSPPKSDHEVRAHPHPSVRPSTATWPLEPPRVGSPWPPRAAVGTVANCRLARMPVPIAVFVPPADGDSEADDSLESPTDLTLNDGEGNPPARGKNHSPDVKKVGFTPVQKLLI